MQLFRIPDDFTVQWQALHYNELIYYKLEFTQGVNVPHFIQVMKNALMTATLFMGRVLESGHEYLLVNFEHLI